VWRFASGGRSTEQEAGTILSGPAHEAALNRTLFLSQFSPPHAKLDIELRYIQSFGPHDGKKKICQAEVFGRHRTPDRHSLSSLKYVIGPLVVPETREHGRDNGWQHPPETRLLLASTGSRKVGLDV